MLAKLKFEDVKAYIEGEGYELLTLEHDYIGSQHNITVQCDKNHKPYPVTFSNFKRGKRCKQCYFEGRRTPYNEVKNFIELFNYTLLTPENEYVKTTTDILVSCPNKEHDPYKTRFNTFKADHRCSECSKTQYNEVKNFIESFNYKLLTSKIDYIDTMNNILVQCDKMHLPYKTSFNSFKTGRRCQQCNKVQYNDIKKYIEQCNYKLLTSKIDYINTYTNITVQCDKNHIYPVTFSAFKNNGQRCKQCANDNLKLSYKEVKEFIESFNYTLLSKEYVNGKTKLKVMCDDCHIYPVRFNDFKTGSRCPICKQSKGEAKISNWLDNVKLKNNYIINDIIPQHKYIGCKDKQVLKFDFYVEISTKKTNKVVYSTLIEYDGLQHYKPVKFFGGKKGLKETQRRDKIKDKYVEDNNLNFLRIPYWDFDNIEKILNKQFKNFIKHITIKKVA